MFELDYPRGLTQILKIATFTRLAELTDLLAIELKNIVHSGPFTGMQLPIPAEKKLRKLDSPYGWSSPRLLGCYEQELHPSIEQAIQRNPEIIVNIGSGEGHYAVGMARRLPEAQVYAFDPNTEAQSLCALAAEQNEVAERVHVRGECDQETFLEFARNASDKRTLFIIDCEGYEMKMLNQYTVPALKKCDLIIECHDFKDRNTTPVLTQLFITTHELQIIKEGERNPSALPPLHFISSLDRWLLICEFRPEVMFWLTCWSR